MSAVVPVAYVVDHDISVRESLELLIRTVGWQAQLLKSAQRFLCCPKVTAPRRPGYYSTSPTPAVEPQQQPDAVPDAPRVLPCPCSRCGARMIVRATLAADAKQN
jgi:hypothetical protein